MMFSEEEQRWVRKVAEDSGAKIENSAVFLSLFTENYKSDPLAALQFGIAILLNKPMFFAIEQGTVVNENVTKVAHGIEYYDSQDPLSVQAAVGRLLDKAGEMGFLDDET